jgi:hypothetical protein
MPRPEPEEEPAILEIYLGSSRGMSYGAWWDGECLIYESFTSGYRGWEQCAVAPSRAQWRRFWESMDAIGVWRWSERYEPGERFESRMVVRAGVHWSLTLAHAGRDASSSGDGAGPTAIDLDEDTTFARFLEAVSRLLGGRPFA